MLQISRKRPKGAKLHLWLVAELKSLKNISKSEKKYLHFSLRSRILSKSLGAAHKYYTVKRLQFQLVSAFLRQEYDNLLLKRFQKKIKKFLTES